MNEIVQLIRRKVVDTNAGNLSPAICISGGIDSTVVLYHVIHDLMGGVGSKLHTFTAAFGNEVDERKKAKRVADYYSTIHTEISITKTEVISRMKDILRNYQSPRYSVWGWIMISKIKEYKITDLFTGEGGDEIFGYGDRSFLQGWTDQLMWVNPGWTVPCDYYNIRLHRPFMEIQEDVSVPITEYYKPPNKEMLRDIYRDILPHFVIIQSSTPPSLGFYGMMGMTTEDLQIMAASAFLESRK